MKFQYVHDIRAPGKRNNSKDIISEKILDLLYSNLNNYYLNDFYLNYTSDSDELDKLKKRNIWK